MRPARVLVCAVAVLVVGSATEAAADPADPVAPSDGPPVVLVASVAPDASVAGVADRADDSQADVRHVLAPLHRVSVTVPAGDVDTEARRLDALPGVTSVTRAARRYVSAVPNDALYARQQKYLAAINAPAAWDITKGSSTVKIGIVDTGVDVGHPDLDGKIVGTYDAASGGSAVPDRVGHGTFVAGVAAAETGNGAGVAGAGYDASLLVAKVDRVAPQFEDGYDITTADEAAGIVWAADNGAKIINISLGAEGFDQTEYEAVAYAQRQGALVVAAAGNAASSIRNYPAAYPGVLAVGATDAAGRRAGFSNYGSWVDLAAPGTNIESTAVRTGSTFWPGAGSYRAGDGTSFSSPLVAGAAALLATVDPDAAADQLANALTTTARGYTGLGLGAGQVDIAAATKALLPTSVPATPTQTGTSGSVVLRTTSSAKAVRFGFDGTPSTLATVAANTATVSFPTFGFADGPHEISAADCTSSGYCGPSSAGRPVTIDNDAPTLTSPATDDRVDGDLTLRATAPGGGVAFYADGARVGFDATSPYSAVVPRGSLTNGRHAITTRSCTTSGSICNGPESEPTSMVIAWIHPVINSVTPATFSPNADGASDTATVAYTLGEAAAVAVRVTDATGETVVDPTDLGTVAAGPASWTWDGRSSAGAVVRSGRYTVELTAVADIDGSPAQGTTNATTVVDLAPPALVAASAAPATFYPVRDGYLDVITPSATLGETALLTLTVRTASGTVVRTATARRNAGRNSLSWSGIDTAGRLVRAGTYRYAFTATDGAGNRTVTAARSVVVSSKRLVTVSRTLTRRGSQPARVVRDAKCEKAVRSKLGRRLINSCVPGRTRTVQAAYAFTLPAAVSYTSLTTSVRGRSLSQPARITGRVTKVRGGSTATTTRTVRSTKVRTYSLGHVAAAGHVTSGRVAQVLVGVTNRYSKRGNPSDLDIGGVTLRVTYRVLR